MSISIQCTIDITQALDIPYIREIQKSAGTRKLANLDIYYINMTKMDIWKFTGRKPTYPILAKMYDDFGISAITLKKDYERFLITFESAKLTKETMLEFATTILTESTASIIATVSDNITKEVTA